jgi:hypothetical protein
MRVVYACYTVTIRMMVRVLIDLLRQKYAPRFFFEVVISDTLPLCHRSHWTSRN